MRAGREDGLSLSEIQSSAKIPGRGDAGSEPTPAPAVEFHPRGSGNSLGCTELWAFFFLSRKCLVSGLMQQAPPLPPHWERGLPRVPGAAAAMKVGSGGSGALLRGVFSEGRRSAQVRGFASEIRV